MLYDPFACRARALNFCVGHHSDYGLELRPKRRTTKVRALNLDHRDRRGVEALDEHDVDGGHPARKHKRLRLWVAPVFMKQRPAPVPHHHHFATTGSAQAMGVLARLIQIETIRCALDGRHAETAITQMRDHLGDQCSLAATRTTDEAEDGGRGRAVRDQG